jgi:hypothetical protein
VPHAQQLHVRGETAAMIATMRGPAMLRIFADYGGKFTTQQDKQRNSVESLIPKQDSELRSVYIEAVKRQGGLITLTPADEYEAARIGAAAIQAFVKAGGKFTDKPNRDDLTSAMKAATSGPEAVETFQKAVRHWSDWQNTKGFTVAMGCSHCRTRFQAFFESGGRFAEEQNNSGETAAMLAIDNGPEATKAYARAGGKFTEQESKGARPLKSTQFLEAPTRFAHLPRLVDTSPIMSLQAETKLLREELLSGRQSISDGLHEVAVHRLTKL